MKTKRILILTTAVLMLSASGCQEAPEEVVNENSILDNAEMPDNDEVVLEYATLDEIRASYEEQNKNNPTNIQVNYIRVSQGNAMPTYTIKKHVEKYTDIHDLVKYCYGENTDEHPDRVLTFSHTGDYPNSDCLGSIAYVPEGKDITSCTMISDCGGIAVSSDNNEYRFADNYPLVKEYKLFIGDTPGEDSYIMSDGKELKVCDAILSIEKLYNDYFAPVLENEFTYKVKELFVHQYDDGTYGFSYDMECYDADGNIFATCLKNCADPDGFENGTVPWIAENDCHGYIIDSQMSVYAYQECTPLKDVETDSGEKLLTYKSALEKTSSVLAASRQYEIDMASLEYVVTYKAESGYLQKDETGELSGLDVVAYAHDAKRTPEVRPFWVFRDFEKNTTSQAVYGGLVLVDALTGEVYVY